MLPIITAQAMSGVIGGYAVAGLERYGYISDGKGVAPEYLVKIISYRNRCAIVGVLQQDIAMRVESRWEYLVPSSLLDVGNKLTQFVSRGKWSIITKATSRRVWQGSSPLQISLNLKFEAVEDPYREVVQPCLLLQSIALPSSVSYDEANTEKFLKKTGITKGSKEFMQGVAGAFLAPPGPAPFTTKGLFTRDNNRSIDDIVKGTQGGDIIKIDIGRFLSFWNVIVKEVSPLFHIKFSESGDPISGSVNIIFESYEMMTVESLKQCYDKNNFSVGKIQGSELNKGIKGKIKTDE